MNSVMWHWLTRIWSDRLSSYGCIAYILSALRLVISVRNSIPDKNLKAYRGSDWVDIRYGKVHEGSGCLHILRTGWRTHYMVLTLHGAHISQAITVVSVYCLISLIELALWPRPLVLGLICFDGHFFFSIGQLSTSYTVRNARFQEIAWFLEIFVSNFLISGYFAL